MSLSNMVQSAISNSSSNIDVSLLEDKENELESIEISGSSLVINKGINVQGEIVCGLIKCDGILTEAGAGIETELTNVIMTNSIINNTSIGNRIPKDITCTNLIVNSSNPSAGISTNGDIIMTGTNNSIRNIKSFVNFNLDNSLDTSITTKNLLSLINK